MIPLRAQSLSDITVWRAVSLHSAYHRSTERGNARSTCAMLTELQLYARAQVVWHPARVRCESVNIEYVFMACS